MTPCVGEGQWAASPRPLRSDSDLFEKSDDILAHVSQPDNHIVVVDVAEGGVVSALPPGLIQNQIPAVHGGHQILVLSETGRKKTELVQKKKHGIMIFISSTEEPERPERPKRGAAVSAHRPME